MPASSITCRAYPERDDRNVLPTTDPLPWWLPLSVLVFGIQMIAYHGGALLFEGFDRTKRFAAFKLRDTDRLTYRELLPRVLANQFLILLPAMVLLEVSGLAFVGAAHLSLWHFLLAMALMTVGHDIVQYVFHRFLLHRPGFMRRLGHGVHHATGATKAISACYMSPADFLLEIVLPYLVPLVLVGAGADIGFHLVVASLGAIGGLYEHSGYDFSVGRQNRSDTGLRPLQHDDPGANVLGSVLAAVRGILLTSQAHAEHHRRSNVSFSDGFGSPGICDTLFRTRWDLAPDPMAEARAQASR
jgi:sterol desaturase/sphingolipid hydroxylase (fatty acid hydroxylase superfamily)